MTSTTGILPSVKHAAAALLSSGRFVLPIPLLAALGLYFCQTACSELVLPPEIAAGISQSSRGESGGLFLHGVDDQVFFDYVCQHWREMADHIEDLPPAEGNFTSKKDAVNASVSHFGAACEWLPPLEYLDFMEKFLTLAEQKRISFRPIEWQMMADCKKQDFLAVNWRHPRVKAIFARARLLTPPREKDFLSWMDGAAEGELADNYMTNMPDDRPLPETLPGIRLEIPWFSLLRFALFGVLAIFVGAIFFIWKSCGAENNHNRYWKSEFPVCPATRFGTLFLLWAVTGFFIYLSYETRWFAMDAQQWRAIQYGLLAPVILAFAAFACIGKSVGSGVAGICVLSGFPVFIMVLLRARSVRWFSGAAVTLAVLSGLGLWCDFYASAHSGP